MTEREIFLAVCELPDPATRAKYLKEVCGNDADLRAGVEALLHSHEAAGSFLGCPAVELVESNWPATLELGQKSASEGGVNSNEALAFLRKSERADSLGRLGHYEVLEVLGKGGFGIVFRAFDDVLQRVVAVKVLAPQMAVTSPARKRFLREARSSAKVRHENIVQVYAVQEQPLPYLVMEFIPGETLQQRLDRTGPLEILEVVQIARQIAKGLAAAHSTGLIHRDIKPGNILIEEGPNQKVKITDFGLARAADDASMTQSGLVAGTPMYMSPEQAKGEALDHRADLFSLGSVLYTMCSGRAPFRANNTLAVLKRVAEDTARPIPEIIPEVPQWLCDIIAKLHAKDPEQRYQSASEVAELLDQWLDRLQKQEGESAEPSVLVLSTTSSGSPGAGKFVKRPKARRWQIAAAAVLVLAFGLALTEATGVTNVAQFVSTVMRVSTPEGTLVVEVNDPDVTISIEGEDLVIQGAGPKEIRLKPGQYKLSAKKKGQIVKQQLVTVSQGGRKVVTVTLEALGVTKNDTKVVPIPAAPKGNTEWEKLVATLSIEGQLKAVADKLKEIDPGFNGTIEHVVEEGQVTRLEIVGSGLLDLTPFRALPGLRSLVSRNPNTKLSSLLPLQEMGLTELILHYPAISDLMPLQGMKLVHLDLTAATKLADLSPLKGMPLKFISLGHSEASDLSPLEGMNLEYLNCAGTKVTNLSPLKGMPLSSLVITSTAVADLTPLTGMPLVKLDCPYTLVNDLTPLKGMSQLKELYVQESKVKSLAPLKGLSLVNFNCSNTQVTDLSSLQGMKLKSLFCDNTKAPDLSFLKGMPLMALNCRSYDLTLPRNKEMLQSLKSLETVNSIPVDQFWKELDVTPK